MFVLLLAVLFSGCSRTVWLNAVALTTCQPLAPALKTELFKCTGHFVVCKIIHTTSRIFPFDEMQLWKQVGLGWNITVYVSHSYSVLNRHTVVLYMMKYSYFSYSLQGKSWVKSSPTNLCYSKNKIFIMFLKYGWSIFWKITHLVLQNTPREYIMNNI